MLRGFSPTGRLFLLAGFIVSLFAVPADAAIVRMRFSVTNWDNALSSQSPAETASQICLTTLNPLAVLSNKSILFGHSPPPRDRAVLPRRDRPEAPVVPLSPDDATVPSLIRLLSAKNPPEFRLQAACALSRLGPKAAEATSALLDVIKANQHAEHSQKAPSRELFIPRLTAVAELAVRRIGTPAVPGITDLVADTRYRLTGIRLLAMLGPQASSAVPLLVQTLDDPSEQVRNQAVIAIGEVGVLAKAAIPRLETIVANYPDRLAVEAATSLKKVDRQHPDSIPFLLRQLRLAAGPDRERLASTLESLGPICVFGDIPALTRALHEKDPLIRETALRTLAARAEMLQFAGPAMICALEDPITEIRRQAAAVLGVVGDPSVTAALVQLLADPDAEVRLAAVTSLGECGPKAKKALSPLRQIEANPRAERELKARAIEAIRLITSDLSN